MTEFTIPPSLLLPEYPPLEDAVEPLTVSLDEIKKEEDLLDYPERVEPLDIKLDDSDIKAEVAQMYPVGDSGEPLDVKLDDIKIAVPQMCPVGVPGCSRWDETGPSFSKMRNKKVPTGECNSSGSRLMDSDQVKSEPPDPNIKHEISSSEEDSNASTLDENSLDNGAMSSIKSELEDIEMKTEEELKQEELMLDDPSRMYRGKRLALAAMKQSKKLKKDEIHPEETMQTAKSSNEKENCAPTDLQVYNTHNNDSVYDIENLQILDENMDPLMNSSFIEESHILDDTSLLSNIIGACENNNITDSSSKMIKEINYDKKVLQEYLKTSHEDVSKAISDAPFLPKETIKPICFEGDVDNDLQILKTGNKFKGIEQVEQEVVEVNVQEKKTTEETFESISESEPHVVDEVENETGDVESDQERETTGEESESSAEPEEDVIEEDQEENVNVFELSDVQVTKSGAPRKKKSYKVSKQARKSFLQNKNKEAHKVRAYKVCKDKCFEKFSDNQRIEINKKFWDKSFKDRKCFLKSQTKEISIKARRQSTTDTAKKTLHRDYFLKTVDGIQYKVCKNFFMTTLGFASNNDRILRNLSSPPSDNRGKYKRKTKLNYGLIETHIQTYYPTVSHYSRAHAPNKLYLPSDITIRDMHKDFLEKHGNDSVTYEQYRQVVSNKMNISFAKLGHEQCEKCEAFDLHTEHDKNNLINNCSQCQDYKRHINYANDARDQYAIDKELSGKDEDTITYSVDLQKVIMIPRIDMFKSVVFTPRLIVFNECFVPLKSFKHFSPFAVTWHEAISGRKQEDIVSTYDQFFKFSRDYSKIILWADNCSTQNKNWCLFSYLVHIVNSPTISAETITIKYFEPGHTYMSADSYHHLVEQEMKKKSNIYDFQDFVEVLNNIPNTKVKEMVCGDFKMWPTRTTQYQLAKLNANKPLLKEIVEVTAKRGNNYLIFKKDFKSSEEYELYFISETKINLEVPEGKRDPPFYLLALQKNGKTTFLIIC